MPVTVIIPALNEEDWIASSVRSAFEAGAAEVIVVDGGSFDRTARFATAEGARVMLSKPPRARQLNEAMEKAANDFLIFLHADTRLPHGAAAAVEKALSSRFVFGGFRLAFLERSLKLRFVAAMINLRTALTRRPWGDQAQFIRRGSERFREMPIMEDYEMAQRMRERGRVKMVSMKVTTSGRRFLRLGVMKTALLNWKIIAAFKRGVDPETLARRYTG